MALQIRQRLACIAAAVVFAMVRPSQGQTCSSEKMENVTVDILLAFSKGLRGTDPVYTLSWEACISACCSETVAGDKSCNYVVFYPKKKSHSPNCYRFYYPDKKICPMKQAFGLVTYRIIKDQETPRSPPPRLNKLSHPAANGRLGQPAGGRGPLAPQPGGVFGPAKQHVGEVSGPSQQPSPERSSLAATTGSQARGSPTAAPRISASRPPVQPPNTGRTRGAANQPKRTPPPQPSAPFKTGLPQLHLRTSRLPAPISSAPGHLSNGQLGLEDSASEKEASLLGDQRILVAVLCFGVLFFLQTTLLIGRKMIGSLQKRQYAQLDYLINDMYVKM